MEEIQNLETPRILRMNHGIGDQSYATNSISQRKYQSGSRPLLHRAVAALCAADLPSAIAVADLGCSSGPNALFALSEIVGVIHRRCCGDPPELMVFLNDLVENDFNSVFRGLSKFCENLKEKNGGGSSVLRECFVAGVPGSFYGRLFPFKSLHFVHSSSSLHWLSQVPRELMNEKGKGIRNKGKIFISKTSPSEVIEAYYGQFKKDFNCFLESRSKEVVSGGRMVLTFRGRRQPDPCPDETCLLWDYLGLAFQALVHQGLIEEEKLDNYNTPYYEPYMEDVKKEIEKEGSFKIENLEIIALPWDGVNKDGESCERSKTTQQMAKAIQAVNESMIRSHFGGEIIEPLFKRFREIMEADTKEVEHVSLVVSLVRKEL
ncbi:salicylate carboxymethyltransferase-like [Benincasa hispida]|uniref:salicylate carboxymethyltransferase-like n=1 Tax=Benincasa hispida TaxID=102211 RepID=UPI00190222C3|nr:salicylate carboxymethyltransferase-like [Benincasa hispida]